MADGERQRLSEGVTIVAPQLGEVFAFVKMKLQRVDTVEIHRAGPERHWAQPHGQCHPSSGGSDEDGRLMLTDEVAPCPCWADQLQP